MALRASGSFALGQMTQRWKSSGEVMRRRRRRMKAL
jgi:hypothetical protein